MKRLTLYAVLLLTMAAHALYAAGETADYQAERDYPYPHGMVNALFVHGNFAITANSWSRGEGVSAFDLSDPANPRYVGGVPSLGYIMSCDIKDNTAYFSTTFSVCVVRLPSEKGERPILVENMLVAFPFNGADKVRVCGNRLFVTSQDAMRVYNIKRPDTPVLEAYLPECGNIQCFEPVNSDDIQFYYVRKSDKKQMYAFGMQKRFGRSEMDMNTIPFAQKHELPTSNKDFSVKLENNAVEVYQGEKRVSTFNVVYHEGPLFADRNVVYGVAPTKNAYVLYGFDLSKPYKKDSLPDYRVTWEASPEKRPLKTSYDIVLPAAALLKHGNYLFAPQALFDISNIRDIRFLKHTTPYAASGMAISNSERLVMAQGALMTVFDISKLPELQTLAEIRPDAEMTAFYDVQTDDNYIYAWSKNALGIYDAKTFKRISVLKLDTVSYKILKHGSYIYVLPLWSAKEKGLIILDVANPAEIKTAVRIKQFISDGTCYGKIENNVLYLSDGDAIKAFSLKNKLAPEPLAVYSSEFDTGVQSYNYFDFTGGKLVGKKYPRFDVWTLNDKENAK